MFRETLRRISSDFVGKPKISSENQKIRRISSDFFFGFSSEFDEFFVLKSISRFLSTFLYLQITLSMAGVRGTNYLKTLGDGMVAAGPNLLLLHQKKSYLEISGLA